jgi:hypothetical protein
LDFSQARKINLLSKMIRLNSNKFLLRATEAATSVVQPIFNRLAWRAAQDIPLELRRRALASTVDFVQQHMRCVKASATKFQLLDHAFQQSNVSEYFQTFVESFVVNFVENSPVRPNLPQSRSFEPITI